MYYKPVVALHDRPSHSVPVVRRAIVRYAREATVSLQVSDATWSALRAHFSLRETMDVVMAVAWYNAVARILLPLEIDLEDWYRRS